MSDNNRKPTIDYDALLRECDTAMGMTERVSLSMMRQAIRSMMIVQCAMIRRMRDLDKIVAAKVTK